MILCCGEALIDMLPRKMEEGSEVFLPIPGGAVFNTAIALGRLGEDTGFFSSLSTDMFGQQLVDFLNESNVDTELCVHLSNPSTLAFVNLDNGQAAYSFFNENSALQNLETSHLPVLPSTISTLHFGAISLIPEPCGEAYETLMANNQDKVLSLDPNIRVGFIKNESKHRARIKRMIAMADIIKVSDEDLDWIANGESSKELISLWLEGSTNIVLLTEGEKGVTAFTENGLIRIPAPSVEVIDTIGAGDTFNAGFIAGLRKTHLLSKDRIKEITLEDLKPTLELATKVAALTISKAGANPPWATEL